MSSLRERIVRLERTHKNKLTPALLEEIKKARQAIWECVPTPPGVRKVTLEEHDAMMDELRANGWVGVREKNDEQEEITYGDKTAAFRSGNS